MTDKANGERELSITRHIDAPPETVWRVWTERTGEWFAPEPWTTPVVDYGLRPGGRANITMRSPEGEDMPLEGVVLEVVPNRKIVTTDAFSEGWRPQEAFMVMTVTLDPEDDGTRYTARVRHWSDEALKRHEEMGFHEGWAQVADQLAEIAEAETARA